MSPRTARPALDLQIPDLDWNDGDSSAEILPLLLPLELPPIAAVSRWFLQADDCPAEDQLARLVRGELAGEALGALRAHLDRCNDCRALVAAALRTGGAA